MIIGIDIGASATKGILFEDMKIVFSHVVPTKEPKSSALKILEHLIGRLGNDAKNLIELVAITGGGHRKLTGNLVGLPTLKVDEISATGLGGLLLTKKEAGLVVSIGTGTVMVASCEGGKKTNHVVGTGVGGGTIIGLSKRILGITNFKILEMMAQQGDPRNVDLSVTDIIGGPIGIVPGEATASNFGKTNGKETADDLAAAIFRMVSQVVGTLAAMAAKAYNLQECIVFAGGLPRSEIFSKDLQNAVNLFGGKSFIPEMVEFCGAYGAAGYAHLSKKGLLA